MKLGGVWWVLGGPWRSFGGSLGVLGGSLGGPRGPWRGRGRVPKQRRFSRSFLGGPGGALEWFWFPGVVWDLPGRPEELGPESSLGANNQHPNESLSTALVVVVSASAMCAASGASNSAPMCAGPHMRRPFNISIVEWIRTLVLSIELAAEKWRDSGQIRSPSEVLTFLGRCLRCWRSMFRAPAVAMVTRLGSKCARRSFEAPTRR